MRFDELKEKALSLPLSPGVYIMKDKTEQVIYVGKAKKLKNRVSQYFQNNSEHSAKTQTMVSKIDHFDVIIAASEFEALVLENALIKQYMPRYNILLKDDKGYPYIRLNMKDAYPRFAVVNKVTNDGASYFGPYGSRGVTNQLIETILNVLGLPTCTKQFPRDIGKDRPCLHYHMNQCAGWCQDGHTKTDYRRTIEQARQLLLGNYKTVTEQIRKQMLEAADSLNFELAANLRNQVRAIDALGKQQHVTAGSAFDTDVIGYGQTESKACFTVLHFRSGNLIEKDFEIFPLADDPAEAVSSLVVQYYLSKETAPKNIYLPIALEDQESIVTLFEKELGKKIKLTVPQRGHNVRLVEMANNNAVEEIQRITSKEEKLSGTLNLLAKILDISIPTRIESFDISNISGTDMVASMVVFQNGKPYKSSYKRFKIKSLDGQDDYGAMREIIHRRFTNYINAEDGFNHKPDLLLIDGGVAHACVAVEALSELGLTFPVFGMVKDDRHRTRALVTPEGKQIGIDTQQSVFSLIGNIQEETHRFAITFHRELRSKRLRYSELDSIPGIGEKRKHLLLKRFKSIQNIRNASLLELEQVLTKDAALNVYEHYRREGDS